MSELGTLEELPIEYRQQLTDLNLLPLWPSLRNVLPYGMPDRATLPTHWRYEDYRPLLMQAGELTPIEKAERRVLVLANPGLGLEKMMATPTIYIGMQMIQPGELAPNHKHSPSAVRFVVEGNGGFTVVEGERLPMEKGDLILTPSGLWHEHGHTGTGPVVWLDALDLPFVHGIEASYCIEGKPQVVSNAPDSSQSRYRRSGLVPYTSLGKARHNYPMTRFPWKEVKQSLFDLATVCDAHEEVRVAYVNPETGQECMPTLGFSALMLRPGEELKLPRRSSSGVVHVVEGNGESSIDNVEMQWTESSTMAIPTHARVTHRNSSNTEPAFLFIVDDAPMQRKLGFYEEF